jgi:hypothetical protein
MGYMLREVISWNHDLSQWNTASVIVTMADMFHNAVPSNKEILSLEHRKCYDNGRHAMSFNQDIWDNANDTTMKAMFRNAIKFNQDLSQWYTANVTSRRRRLL